MKNVVFCIVFIVHCNIVVYMYTCIHVHVLYHGTQFLNIVDPKINNQPSM